MIINLISILRVRWISNMHASFFNNLTRCVQETFWREINLECYTNLHSNLPIQFQSTIINFQHAISFLKFPRSKSNLDGSYLKRYYLRPASLDVQRKGQSGPIWRIIKRNAAVNREKKRERERERISIWQKRPCQVAVLCLQRILLT